MAATPEAESKIATWVKVGPQGSFMDCPGMQAIRSDLNLVQPVVLDDVGRTGIVGRKPDFSRSRAQTHGLKPHR